MKTVYILAGLLLGLSVNAVAETPQNIIFITWDGVRRNEVTENKNFLPLFWGKHVNEGVLINASVANSARISLPGYFNMMTGEVQPCVTNECSRITVETIGERVRREIGRAHV